MSSPSLLTCALSVDSDKCRDLVDAVQIPIKNPIPLFDDAQFPPVAVVAAEWQSTQQHHNGTDGTAINTKGNNKII